MKTLENHRFTHFNTVVQVLVPGQPLRVGGKDMVW